MDSHKSLGERIKKERVMKRMTQSDLGKLVSVSRQAISSYESNRTEPDYNTLGSLAKVFNVSVEYLINGKEEQREQHNTHGLLTYGIIITTTFIVMISMESLYIKFGKRYFRSIQLIEFVYMPFIVFLFVKLFASKVFITNKHKVLKTVSYVIAALSIIMSLYLIVSNDYSVNVNGINNPIIRVFYNMYNKIWISNYLCSHGEVIFLYYGLLGLINGLFA